MSVYAVENFAYGLDSRRSPLSKAPGTLITLRNGFITNGGEITKRKAFKRVALPNGCFGLEVTEKGLTTFGNAALATLLDADGYIISLREVGRDVYYQRLLHPVQVLLGENTVAPSLKRVQCSTNAGGKAFVAAVFARVGDPTAEDTFTYYDGNLVWDSALGLVFNSGADTRNKQATALLAAVEPLEALGWQFSSLEPQGLIMYSPSGNAMTGEVSVESANELAQMRLIHGNGNAGIEADGPEFNFTITAGNYTNVQFQITINEDGAYPFSIYSNLANVVYVLYALTIDASNHLRISLRDKNHSYPSCDLGVVAGSSAADYAVALVADSSNLLVAKIYKWDSGSSDYVLEGTVDVYFGTTHLSSGALQGTAAEVAQEIVDNINVVPHWWYGKTNDNENFTAQLTGTATIVIKAPPSFAGSTVTYTVADFSTVLASIPLQTTAAGKNLLVDSVSNDLVVSAAAPIALAVTIVPFPVYTSVRRNSTVFGAQQLYTPVVKAVVTGGSSNYTYTWTRIGEPHPTQFLYEQSFTDRPDSHQWNGWLGIVGQTITEQWKLRVVDSTDTTKEPVEIEFPVTLELLP